MLLLPLLLLPMLASNPYKIRDSGLSGGAAPAGIRNSLHAVLDDRLHVDRRPAGGAVESTWTWPAWAPPEDRAPLTDVDVDPARRSSRWRRGRLSQQQQPAAGSGEQNLMHPHTPQPEQAAAPVAKAEQQHRCTIPEVSAATLTMDEFARHYQTAQPLCIRHSGTRSSPNAELLGRWTAAHLVDVAGSAGPVKTTAKLPNCYCHCPSCTLSTIHCQCPVVAATASHCHVYHALSLHTRAHCLATAMQCPSELALQLHCHCHAG